MARIPTMIEAFEAMMATNPVLFVIVDQLIKVIAQ